MPSPPPALTPLELAGGLVLGGALAPLPQAASTDAQRALIDAVRPAARRGPCLISFSGGVDSSLVLAAATRAAAEEGAPPPIPITWRAGTDAPAAHESDWQEEVVAELGLPEWERLDAGDDLDYVGPVARAVIARHGILWPANGHLHDPLLAQARGGTLLTGIGGDQLFGWWRWSAAASARTGRRLPVIRRLPTIALARAPLAVRAAVEQRRSPVPSPWLTRAPERKLARAIAREFAGEPATWDQRVRWQAGRRSLQQGLAGLGLLAAHHGAQIEHPLLSPGVLATVGLAGGRAGYPDRAEAVRELFTGLLPAAVAVRRSKATFDEVFVRAPSRAVIADWTGSGVDATLVDAAGLASVWTDSVPMRTALLLQQIATQR